MNMKLLCLAVAALTIAGCDKAPDSAPKPAAESKPAAVPKPVAVVAPVLNYERDGRPVLVPEVREYKAESGVCKLPAKLTVAVPAGEELIIEELGAELKRFGNSAVAEKPAFCRFELAAKDVPEHPQGYVIDVGADGIRVTARTTDGLFYGAQTLVNLLRNAGSPELKCCRITDYPDFDRRGYFLGITQLPAKDMVLFKRTIDALAKLKFNWLMLSLSETFPFKNNPLTLLKKAFTR